MTDSPSSSNPVRRVVETQQAAALERRHWVRIAYACNNRCRFCLDASITHDGPFVPADAARARIDAGRAEGATRLILSGGEASIHPDFLDLVRYGRQRGYRRVQTITNGRMFAYGRFLRDSLAAGLGEITFSIHSHRPEVHDRLTGVTGAFEQALRGLRRALAADVVVSVDIVINRENVSHLAEAVRWFSDLGVGEFDLLHLVPFGRAFDPQTGRVDLAVPMPALQRALAETFALAERRQLVVWTNRLPAPALEGYEHYIQDPHKLEDEVRGRHEHMSRLVENGTPLPCRDERCHVCYLQHFCDVLHPLQAQVARRELPRVRVSLEPGRPAPDLTPLAGGLEALWIRASHLAAGLSVPRIGVPEVWELEDWSGLAEPRLRRALAERPVRRAVARRAADLERLLAAPEVSGDRLLWLDREGLAWATDRLMRAGTGVDGGAAAGAGRAATRIGPGLSAAVCFGVQTFETLEETAARAVDLGDPALAALVAAGARLEGLPPCLGGVAPELDPDDFVDLDSLDSEGRLDPDRYVQRYLRERYRVHSVRCARCVHRARCPGLHVNLVRAQGFSPLRPVQDAGALSQGGAPDGAPSGPPSR